MSSFPLYDGDKPVMSPATIPPYPGLNWEASISDVLALLGEPASNNGNELRFDFPQEGNFVQFGLEDGHVVSSRYQIIFSPTHAQAC